MLHSSNNTSQQINMVIRPPTHSTIIFIFMPHGILVIAKNDHIRKNSPLLCMLPLNSSVFLELIYSTGLRE